MQLPQQDKLALELYEAAARRNDKQRRYLGFSEIGDPCSRKLWYRFRGYTAAPLDGRVIMIFNLGNLVEDYLVELFAAAGYPITGRQRRFEYFGGLFAGHWDGQIEGVANRPYVWDAKTCNDKSFNEFKAKGIKKEPRYYAQAQMYMHASGLDRAIFSFYNKNTSAVYNEKIYYVKPDAHELIEKARNIISVNTPPACGHNESSTACSWCDYRTLCRQPDMHIQKAPQCGLCLHCRFEDTKPLCAKHGELKTWGISCPEYEMSVS